LRRIGEDVAGTLDPLVGYPRFIEGARRAPPEDVGGLTGFEEFLGAMADPKHHEHDRVLAWYGHLFEADDIGLATIDDRWPNWAGAGPKARPRLKKAARRGARRMLRFNTQRWGE
jgi:hypothetical protein